MVCPPPELRKCTSRSRGCGRWVHRHGVAQQLVAEPERLRQLQPAARHDLPAPTPHVWSSRSIAGRSRKGRSGRKLRRTSTRALGLEGPAHSSQPLEEPYATA